MNRLPCVLLLFAAPAWVSAQCGPATQQVADVILTNSNQHSTGGHSASTQFYDFNNPTPPNLNSNNITATCNYTLPNSGTTCNTSCSVGFAGGGGTSERGTLNSTGTHNLYMSTATGQSSTAAGGATCTGAFAGGAANCGPGGCQSSVGLTVTVNGTSINASFSGLAGSTSVWTEASPITITCPAQSTGGGGGGGGGPVTEYDPGTSPIILDSQAEGFHLTSATDGVSFDISGTGHPMRIAWTDPRFHNAFLALPGSDGLVHNGKQLFGNFTSQPASPHPNGFLALEEYDQPENGGNGDGVIDAKDAVYSRLRLWIDENHDGISQPNELHTLPELGVYSLALSYFESRRTDQFGNEFRYKARVDPGAQRDPIDNTPSGDPGRWTYDVFLVIK
jgi:hypothetical protein